MSFTVDDYMTATLAGEDADTAAWFLLNKDALIASESRRPASDEYDGFDGVFPFAETDDELDVDLKWVITGIVAPDGSPYANPSVGLATNKKLWLARYYRPTLDQFGCADITVTEVDGTEWAGRYKPRRREFAEGEFEIGAVLTVNLPRGRLLEVGP